MTDGRGLFNRIAVVCVLASIATWSCAGSEPTVDSYFRELREAGETASHEIEPLQEKVHAAMEGASGKEIIESYQAYVRSAKPVIDHYVRDVESATPPKGLESEHEAYVDAVGGVASAIEEGAENLDGVETVRALVNVLLLEVIPAQLRLQAACKRLEDAFWDKAYGEVDLECDVWSASLGLT